ncbi:hypothetical protein IWQ60_011874 [Tieghemiomyces parasiticus]|uniref:Uncharacterized protein n=1 Tax=Tieghemiomyces parasiticus TaxID=78921 RepID=A0A9W7ZIT3_9FUNG|nr:hypothetical protein IWQ60_011874 [Tieghemiomyces parasiticus]
MKLGLMHAAMVATLLANEARASPAGPGVEYQARPPTSSGGHAGHQPKDDCDDLRPNYIRHPYGNDRGHHASKPDFGSFFYGSSVYSPNFGSRFYGSSSYDRNYGGRFPGSVSHSQDYGSGYQGRPDHARMYVHRPGVPDYGTSSGSGLARDYTRESRLPAPNSGGPSHPPPSHPTPPPAGGARGPNKWYDLHQFHGANDQGTFEHKQGKGAVNGQPFAFNHKHDHGGPQSAAQAKAGGDFKFDYADAKGADHPDHFKHNHSWGHGEKKHFQNGAESGVKTTSGHTEVSSSGTHKGTPGNGSSSSETHTVQSVTENTTTQVPAGDGQQKEVANATQKSASENSAQVSTVSGKSADGSVTSSHSSSSSSQSSSSSVSVSEKKRR